MCKHGCCSTVAILILTIIGAGVSFALLIVGVLKFNDIKDIAEEYYFIILIVIICIGGVALILSIISSFTSSKCFRIFVSILLYLYAIIIAALGIIIILFKGKFQDLVINYLHSNLPTDETFINIENVFACCADISSQEKCLDITQDIQKCSNSIPEDIKLFSYIFLGVFLLGFVLLFVTAIIFDCTSCCYNKNDDTSPEATPLSYIW